MDTIYGPARVTASGLVKKWRISMQEGGWGGSKAEEPRWLFSLTFMASPNRWPTPGFLRNSLPAGCFQNRAFEWKKHIASLSPPFDLKCVSWGRHTVQSFKSRLLCVWRTAQPYPTASFLSPVINEQAPHFTTQSSSAAMFGWPCLVTPWVIVCFPPEMLCALEKCAPDASGQESRGSTTEVEAVIHFSELGCF